MKNTILDKEYVKDSLKKSKSEVKTIKDKTEYTKKMIQERLKELEKKQKKETELGNSLSSLLSSNSIPLDYCEHILPRAINQEILTPGNLKEVILAAKKGDCYFYYSCSKRKPECGCKIKRRTGSIFKD